ncbi:MAG: DMT family transporter [Vicinamibacteria bacterium]|nr:DMT family transporter [Vicinamibacteria bacterium]
MSKHHAPHTPFEWFLLAAPGLIWGASFLFIAEGLEAMAPNGVTFTRLLVGFLTLSIFPAARGPVRREDRAGIFWVGVLWMAFPLSMFPFAEQHITSAMTGMLNGANPLFVVIVAALLARSMPSGSVVIGLVVGMAGAAMIAWPGLGEGSNSVLGIGLVMAALVSYGVALNLARPLQQRNGGLPVIWRALGVALILTAPLGLPELLAARWTLRSALSMLALGSMGTATAQVLMARAAGRFGASTASGSTFLIPVVALALGVIVRGERVAAVSVIGGAVCLAGAWLISRK